MKNRNIDFSFKTPFFAENWQKSLKIITELTPNFKFALQSLLRRLCARALGLVAGADGNGGRPSRHGAIPRRALQTW
jgi:hypothetical protein